MTRALGIDVPRLGVGTGDPDRSVGPEVCKLHRAGRALAHQTRASLGHPCSSSSLRESRQERTALVVAVLLGRCGRQCATSV